VKNRKLNSKNMEQYALEAPSKLKATVKLPASKSISNRALIICALAGGRLANGLTDEPIIFPENLSDCDDTDVLVKAFKERPETIDIKAAGTAMRFMTAFLSATELGSHLLTGTERMKHRPIKMLVDALRQLGADIRYAGEEGYPPLLINGSRLDGGTIEIAGNISSQFISALLLIGPVLKNGLEVRLSGNIISRPYIDLTLWTMREFGAEAEWTSKDTISVKSKGYESRPYLVENDWSAASYWYEMVALSQQSDVEVRLEGLMDGSKQGDSSVRYIFSLLGVKTKFVSKNPGVPTTVILKKSGRCVPRLDYDFVNAPDLAQTFVVTCGMLNIPFHFTGLKTLKIKETDRIEALKKEMRKLGFVIRDVDGCELLWDGERCEPEAIPAIDTYEDHRMALAFSPVCLKRPISINNPHVVTKSYPHFWNDLQQFGFQIERKEL